LKARIRELQSKDIASCAEILAGLPEWFGRPESNRAYIGGLSHLPCAVAENDGRIIGFVEEADRFSRTTTRWHFT